MNATELIASVLDNLRRNFYTDTNTGRERTRDFKRDERQLMKAIATYGHECNQRGWMFEADFIYQELMRLLLKIRTTEADIEYLPVYLEGAIRRHIGQRAEELSAKAKALPTKIGNVIADTTSKCKVVPDAMIRKPAAVEVFTEVYRGISKIQRERRRAKKSATKERQEQLL